MGELLERKLQIELWWSKILPDLQYWRIMVFEDPRDESARVIFDHSCHNVQVILNEWHDINAKLINDN